MARMQAWPRSIFVGFWAIALYALLTPLTVMGATGVQGGIDWLLAQQRVDGAFQTNNDLVPPFLATAEVLLTLDALGHALPAASLSYIDTEAHQGLQYLSNKIRVARLYGAATGLLEATLLRYQSPITGGFAEQPGFHATPLNTGFALLTADPSVAANADAIRNALSWLGTRQLANGGFGLSDANDASVMVTALVSLAAQRYQLNIDVSALVDGATSYLLSRMDPTSLSNWESAWLLLAVMPTTTDATKFQSLADHLLGKQSLNGDWDADVYTTALALRAMFAYQQLNVQPNPNLAGLGGQVVDAVNGSPLASATVAVTGADGRALLSAEDGRFQINSLAAGNYTLTVDLSGYSQFSQNLDLSAGQFLDLGLIRLVPLPDTAIVQGYVTDYFTGMPIRGAVIEIMGAQVQVATTGADGYYRFVGAPGDITVSAAAAGYDTEQAETTLVQGDVLWYSPSLNISGTVPTDLYVLVTGNVKDLASERAIESAVVQDINSSSVVYTDVAGSFTMAYLNAGLTDLSFSAPGYDGTRLRLLANAGDFVNLGTIFLAASVTQNSLTLSGRVSDFTTGAPIQGAQVFINAVNKGVLSDANGLYTINDVPINGFSVTTQAVGYATVDTRVDSPHFNDVELDFALRRQSLTGIAISKLETAQPTYPAVTEVEIDVTLTNSGATDRVVWLFVKVTDIDGNILENYPAVVIPMGGSPTLANVSIPAYGETVSNAEWNTDRYPAGDYQIIIQAVDISSGQLTAEKSLWLAVEPTRRIGGQASFNPPLSALAANRPVAINADVYNRGNLPIENTTLTAVVRLKNLGYQLRQDLVTVTNWLDGAPLSANDGMDFGIDGSLYIANMGAHNVLRATADGNVSVFADGLSSPVDVDVDAQGNVYILNSRDTILIVRTDGTREEIPTTVYGHRAIEALDDGRVLVATYTGVYLISADGTVSEWLPKGLSAPGDIVRDQQGRIYITDRNTSRVMLYEDGGLSPLWENVPDAYGIARDDIGNLYVTGRNTNSLSKISPQGDITMLASGLSDPYDVELDRAGNAIVSNHTSGEIIQVDPVGNKQILVAPSINRPESAATDPDGNIYVANLNTRTILKESPTGSRETFSTGAYSPYDLVVNGDGTIDFLDTYSRLWRIEQDGTIRARAAGFLKAQYINQAPDGDGVLVSEYSGQRISQVHADDTVSVFADTGAGSVHRVLALPGGDVLLANRTYIMRVAADGLTSRFAEGFSAISDMVLESTGSVLVCDETKKQVSRVYADGGKSVIADTAFKPGRMVVTQDQRILISQSGSNLIYELLPSGDTVDYLSLAATIYSMVVDSNGNIWASHHNLQRTLSKIALDGTITQVDVGFNALSVSADQIGGVYVGSYGEVRYVAADGTLSITKPSKLLGIWAYGTAQAEDGDFWVVNSGSAILRFDRDWNVRKHYRALSSPRGITALPSGGVIVVTGESTVLEIPARGHLAELRATGSFYRAEVEATGTVLLNTQNKVVRFDPADGSLTDVVGGYKQIAAMAPLADGRFVLGDGTLNQLGYHLHDGTLEYAYVGSVAPKTVLITRDGKRLVSNSYPDQLCRIDEHGNLRIFSSAASVAGLYEEVDGTISAVASGHIMTLAQDGSILNDNYFTPNDIRGVLRGANGNLFLSASGARALYELFPDFSVSKTAVGVVSPYDIERHPDGTVYFSDFGASVVQSVRADGAIVMELPSVGYAWRLAFTPEGVLYAKSYANRVIKRGVDGQSSLLPLRSLLEAEISGLAYSSRDNTLYAGLGFTYGGYLSKIVKIDQTPPLPTVAPGEIVHRAQYLLETLDIGGAAISIPFGDWLPDVAADYEVQITADSGITGTLTNTIHVGPRLDTELSLAQTRVFPGDRRVTSRLSIDGHDPVSITRLDADNALLVTESHANGRGIAADPQGNLYVNTYTSIEKISPDGSVNNFATGFRPGSGLASDSKSNIYVTSGTKLLKVSQQGEISTLLSSTREVVGVAVNAKDEIFTSITNDVYRIKPGGDPEIFANSAGGVGDGSSIIAGVAVDGHDNVYTIRGAQYTDIISRLSPDGSEKTVYFDKAEFEFEGITLTGDCANNIIFAPIKSLDVGGEEDTLYQIVGNTGEARKILYGPSIDTVLNDMDVVYYDRFNSRILIWTDHSNGKVFSFPAICGGMDMKVHLVSRGDVNVAGIEPAPTAIVERGDGTQEFVWDLKGVDARGLSFDMDLNFLDLNEDERREAFSEAYVTLHNSFAPEQPVRINIGIPTIYASSGMGVAPRTDAPEYTAGAPVRIFTDVLNQSQSFFTGELRLSLRDANGVHVATLPSIAVPGLPGTMSDVFQVDWNSTGFYAGTYVVSAELWNDAGKRVASGETSFELLAGGADGIVITSTVSTDKPLYAAWDTVTVLGRIQNISSNSLVPASVLTLEVYSPTGGLLYTAAQPAPELSPGALFDTQYPVPLNDAPAGNYAVKLIARDALSAALLSEAVTGFAVERSLEQMIEGAVSVTKAQVRAGEGNACTESLHNRSSQAVTGLSVYHRQYDLTSGALLDQVVQVVDLAGGETRTDIHAVDTTGYAPGGYVCVLGMVAKGLDTDLASGGFMVATPTIHSTVASDKPLYQAWDTALIAGTVNNSSASLTQPASKVNIEVFAPDAGLIFTQTQSLPELLPGGTHSVSYTLALVDALAGNYAVKLTARDAQTDAVLSISEATFKVERTLAQALIPAITVKHEHVTRAYVNACTDTLTNRSATRVITGLNIYHRVRDKANGMIVAQAMQSIDLAGDATHKATHEVATANLTAGSYECVLGINEGGSDKDLASVAFAVVEPVVETSVATDKSVYASWDTVLLPSTLGNGASLAILQAANLTVEVTRPDGSVLFSESKPVAELGAGASFETQYSLELIDELSGVYAVSLSAKDALSGDVLSTASASFEVERTLAQALSGEVSVEHAELYQGEPNSCSETLSSRSARVLAGVTVYHRVRDVLTGLVVDEATQTIELGAKEVRVDIHGVDTTSFAPGDYACVLGIIDDGVETELASASFLLHEPPIKIDVSLGVSGRGRLLVLLDDGVNGAGAGGDPLGPDGVPTAQAQQRYLEALLTEAGWSYTLSYDSDAFASELRSGGYSVYLLVAEHAKLAQGVQSELRAAVVRGDGLVVAGRHDKRHNRIDEALGVTYKGKLAEITSLRLDDTVLLPGGGLLVPQLADKGLEVEVLGAQVLGNFEVPGKGKAEPSLSAAAGLHDYIAGRAIYMGWDVLAEAALADVQALEPNPWATLLLNALAVVHPVEVAIQTGASIPVTTTLSNLGIATPGRVLAPIPSPLQVTDGGGGAWLVPQPLLPTLAWSFDLAEDVVLDWTYWLRLPEQAGEVLVSSHVQVGEAPDFETHSSASQIVDVPVGVTLPQALADITSLTQGDKAYTATLSHLHGAQAAYDVNDLEATRAALILAFEALEKVEHVNAEAVQGIVAGAIRQLEMGD